MTESKKQSSKGCGKSRAVRGVAGRTGKESEIIEQTTFAFVTVVT